ALKKVDKPGMAIQVLDDATYTESFTIDDSAKHEGVTLEALKSATIELATAADVLVIRNVPRFRLKGFRIRERQRREFKPGGLPPILLVQGRCPGVMLEALDLRIDGQFAGVKVAAKTVVGEAPIVVTRNTIRGGTAGINVHGSDGVCLRGNT